MKPKIAKLTKEQKNRAIEKAVDMHEVLTRLMVCACHSDSGCAADADPDVHSDAFALLSYITSGEVTKHD